MLEPGSGGCARLKTETLSRPSGPAPTGFAAPVSATAGVGPGGRAGRRMFAGGVAAQVVGKRGGAGVAGRRGFLQTFQTSRLQVRRAGRLDAPRRDRVLAHDAEDDIHLGVA